MRGAQESSGLSSRGLTQARPKSSQGRLPTERRANPRTVSADRGSSPALSDAGSLPVSCDRFKWCLYSRACQHDCGYVHLHAELANAVADFAGRRLSGRGMAAAGRLPPTRHAQHCPSKGHCLYELGPPPGGAGSAASAELVGHLGATRRVAQITPTNQMTHVLHLIVDLCAFCWNPLYPTPFANHCYLGREAREARPELAGADERVRGGGCHAASMTSHAIFAAITT